MSRESPLDPKSSAWEKVHNSGDNPSLMAVAGLDHFAFGKPLAEFEPLHNECTPWGTHCGGVDGLNCRLRNQGKTRGRGRKVTARGCLGLVLCWYRFRGAEFVLQGWFGCTGGQCNVWPLCWIATPEIHVKGSPMEIVTEPLGSVWKSDLLAKSTEINCQ